MAEAASKRSEDDLTGLVNFEAQAATSQNRIGEIRREVEALEIVLVAKKQELKAEEANLARINGDLKAQETTLAEAASVAQEAWGPVPKNIGTDDENWHVFSHIDSIRSRAIGAINAFL